MTAPRTAPPLVSVLVTAYNREEYIADSIESVLTQTLGDFELIVSDDRSRDRTVAIANDYARRDSRIRVSVNDRNLGDYANRRQVAGLARGRFLKYHDSDDVMYRHCLQTMVEPLEAEPRAAFALSASHHWPGGACPMLLTPRQIYEREFLGAGVFHLGPAAAMFRTGRFRALGGFPIAGPQSDYLFWLKACTEASILLVPGDLFHYRLHPGQEIAKPDSDEAHAKAIGEGWTVLTSAACPLDGDAHEQAKRNFVYLVARSAFRHGRSGRWASAWGTVKYSGVSPRDWVRYLRRPRRSMTAGTPARQNVTARSHVSASAT